MLPRRLAVQDGAPGAVMDKVLVDRLGLAVGDRFRLGVQGIPAGRGAAARAGQHGWRVFAGAAHDCADGRSGGVGVAGARIVV